MKNIELKGNVHVKVFDGWQKKIRRKMWNK